MKIEFRKLYFIVLVLFSDKKNSQFVSFTYFFKNEVF